MVNLGFWEKMDRPILCLAPMADVTDTAFRHIISKYSDIPHVTYTEFVSADGLVRAPEAGRRKLLKDLEYSEIERPIVAQFFTGKPEMMEQAAKLAVEFGFDGVDINMGCPDRSIEKQGAGAALMKNPKLAREIIAAAKQGAQKKHKDAPCVYIPVSVKTRLGYNKDEIETWLPELLAEEPAAVIIHARTRKEMSKVPARWECIARAVEIRDITPTSSDSAPLTLRGEAGKTLIIGNGNVESIEGAYKKTEETGCDGVMLGRAVFGNPFLFSIHSPTLEEKLRVLIEHTKLFEEKLGGVKSFAIMKKHFKAYLSGISNTSDLRLALMETNNADEVVKIIKKFLST